MAKQIIRSIRKGSVQWNEEDRLQMVSMLAKAGYAVRIVRKEIPSSETRKTTQYEYVIEYGERGWSNDRYETCIKNRNCYSIQFREVGT